MKKIVRVVVGVLVILSAVFFVACGDDGSGDKNAGVVYGVTFSTGVSGVEILRQDIEAGGKVIKPSDFYREGYVFGGWKKGDRLWNFETDTVNESFELVAVWVQDDTSWAYTEGLTFTAFNDGYQVSGYEGKEAEIKVPYVYNGSNGVKNVVAVGDNAFNGNENVSKVVLSKSVVTIGEGAFKNCANLSEVSSVLNIKEVKAEAFCGTDLTSVEFGENLAVIGERAFNNCGALESVKFNPSLVDLTFGAGAFKNSGVTVLTLPDNLISVGAECFKGSALESVSFGSLSRLETICESAFEGTSLERVVLPESLKSLGSNAFKDVTSLKSVVFPIGVSTVGSQVFLGCSRLEGIFFSGETSSFNGYNADWRGGQFLSYAYSSVDKGVAGYWKYSSIGLPVVYEKMVDISLDFSAIEAELKAGEAITDFVVKVIFFYNSGVSSVSWEVHEVALDETASVAFSVDEYKFFVYNVEVYKAGESTSSRDNLIYEKIDLEPESGTVKFVNFNQNDKTMDCE